MNRTIATLLVPVSLYVLSLSASSLFTVHNLSSTRASVTEGRSSFLDLVGNRESHTNRAGMVTAYETVNEANEYDTISGTPVMYDAAGNLKVDQAGRQYFCDEHNRLKQIKNSGNDVLADYTYDALGRRIVSTIGGATTRYYYDGQSVIEERDASDLRLRYQVNGSQFIDERVATFTASAPGESTGTFTYYLGSNNYSVVGTGNADGSSVTRLDYSPTGDFAGGGPGASATRLRSMRRESLTPGLNPPRPSISSAVYVKELRSC